MLQTISFHSPSDLDYLSVEVAHTLSPTSLTSSIPSLSPYSELSPKTKSLASPNMITTSLSFKPFVPSQKKIHRGQKYQIISRVHDIEFPAQIIHCGTHSEQCHEP